MSRLASWPGNPQSKIARHTSRVHMVDAGLSWTEPRLLLDLPVPVAQTNPNGCTKGDLPLTSQGVVA